MEAPELDLALYSEETSSERQRFALELLSGLSNFGYVKIVNHGISDEEVSRLWQLSKSFFKISDDKKNGIRHEPGPHPQRGWSILGAESSSALYRRGFLKSDEQGVTKHLRDAREHFDMGPTSDHQYPNKWLPESSLPGFRSTLESAFVKLEGISLSIMQALENALELPPGAFLKKITHEKNASEFRLNHYPAIDINEFRNGTISRIWPHFDLGVITLLFQDEIGGLEFENRQARGTFNPVPCNSSSELVVNVSETLQRWTNNRLPAGLHRVDLPNRMASAHDGAIPERYSIAYFCKADRDASVGPLEQFVPENSEPAYKDISAIEYQKGRLLSAY
ncbi:hypothetical protein PVAG01_10932 [Phlyctema vagabunda]|uniref:Fe2OG dioxygenase domain-containing protein n=1 Tax=Phlyctema vagabunda TaxID=108571 RepID=A0ABR4P418_9HELO